jgi:hypothetical protein
MKRKLTGKEQQRQRDHEPEHQRDVRADGVVEVLGLPRSRRRWPRGSWPRCGMQPSHNSQSVLTFTGPRQ